MKHRSKNGFTLVELMVTLILVSIVLSLGVITMRNYIPKQRLVSSVAYLVNLLQRAQSEASTRSTWACVKFEIPTGGSNIRALLFIKKNSDHLKQNHCGSGSGDTADIQIKLTDFRDGVTFATNDCTNNLKKEMVIWFDSTGTPQICPGSTPYYDETKTVCIEGDYQIFLAHPRLNEGARTREIEILAGGMIQKVTPGEKGLAKGNNNEELWARHPPLTDGCY